MTCSSLIYYFRFDSILTVNATSCNSKKYQVPSSEGSQPGGERIPRESNKFPRGRKPLRLESFWTRKCSVEFTYLKSGRLVTKDNYLRVAWWKRLRTTALT